MLCCTNHSYNYECFVLRITDTTKMYHSQKSDVPTVVFAINDSRRSCKLMIPCRLNRKRSYKNNGSWRSQRTLSLRQSNSNISPWSMGSLLFPGVWQAYPDTLKLACPGAG